MSATLYISVIHTKYYPLTGHISVTIRDRSQEASITEKILNKNNIKDASKKVATNLIKSLTDVEFCLEYLPTSKKDINKNCYTVIL